jgi:biopolymer transport protein ExbB
MQMTFDLAHVFRAMGPFQMLVVAALVLMAMTSTAVTLERLWVYARSRRSGRRFAPVATGHLARGDYEGLAQAAESIRGCHLASLLGAGTKTFSAASNRPRGSLSPAELARRELERRRVAIDAELRRGMGVLASTGSVAPFVGLLGTVVGIIAAFQGIAKEGSGGLGAVSAGIAEALVVTALGLLVAIPAVLLFNFLSGRADALMLAIEQSASQLADYLEEKSFSTQSEAKKKNDGTEHDHVERSAAETDLARA